MTEYENYQVYNDGDQWTYNPEMERLFKDRVVKGKKSQRPSSSDAPDNAIYKATDVGEEYRNDPTNGWVQTTSKKGNLTLTEYLQIEESGTDPSTDGEIRLNNGRLKFQANGNVQTVGMPSGMIQMWSGSHANIPDGWTLCDGNNGAPNLQDKFVVGSGNTYSVGDTGGSKTVALTESELASHSHGSGTLSGTGHDHGNGSLSVASHSHSGDSGQSDATLQVDSHSHGNGNLSTGSAFTAHEHTYNQTTIDIDGNSYATGNDFDINLSDSQTSQDGEHDHDVSNGSTGGASPGLDGQTSTASPSVNSGTTGDSSVSLDGDTGTTGSGSGHENRPPYYAIAYIMKL